MIDVWSRTFAATGDPPFRTATAVLAGRYLGKMNSRHLLDYDSVRKNYCNNGHNVTLAMECHQASARFGKAGDGETARLLDKLAAEIDRGFLACRHAPGEPDQGFIATCLTDSGDPCDREGPGPGGYSVLWGMGYGKQTTAMVALHCYHRSRQLGETPQGAAYRDLFLAAADRYCETSLPDKSEKIDVWAVEPALAIFLEVAAYRATGETKYFEAAERLAEEAVQAFFDRTSPLPKASLLSSHYEAMCGPDTLLLALLAVHGQRQEPPWQVPITDLER